MAVVEHFGYKQGVVSKFVCDHGIMVSLTGCLLFWIGVAVLVAIL